MNMGSSQKFSALHVLFQYGYKIKGSSLLRILKKRTRPKLIETFSLTTFLGANQKVIFEIEILGKSNLEPEHH